MTAGEWCIAHTAMNDRVEGRIESVTTFGVFFTPGHYITFGDSGDRTWRGGTTFLAWPAIRFATVQR